MRQRTHEIIEKAQSGDIASKVFDVSIMVLIVLNVLAVILESVQELATGWSAWFRWFEVGSVAVFSIEYGLRLWTAPEEVAFRHPILGRLRFMASPMAVIDLLAILPFFAPMLIPLDLRVLRALRLLRLFRLFKFGRYSSAMRVLVDVLWNAKEELAVTGFVGLLLMTVASSLMFYAENDAQPTVFSSIPAAMWWAVATLTTVGYGDIYPVTCAGKCLAAVIAVLGVGMFALPAGILGSGFMEEVQRRRRKPSQAICPHCGEAIG